MVEVLGVSEEVADRFKNDDEEAWLEVGNLHSDLKAENVEGFWSQVRELVPDFLSEDELAFLISEDNGWGAWKMIGVFDHIGRIYYPTSSPLIRRLIVNSLVFR